MVKRLLKVLAVFVLFPFFALAIVVDFMLFPVVYIISGRFDTFWLFEKLCDLVGDV